MTKRKEITIIIGSLLLIGIMLTTLTLQACKQRPEINDHQEETADITTDDSREYQIHDSVEANGMDSTDTTTLETDTTDTNETTKITETSDINTTPSEEPDTNVILKFNEDGIVIGSPADYESIIINVNGYSYTAKEYFSDNRNAIANWTPIVIENAVKESHSELGLAACYDYETQLNSLIFSAQTDTISYGSDYGIYNDSKILNFSINNISIGSTTKDMKFIFGEPNKLIPYYENSVLNIYVFENSGTLTFRSLDDIILDIDILLTE